MSTDFKKVSILDDRLMTTDSLNYGVFRGGQNVTNVNMPAISATNNSLNFVVPFPSESTILDREVYLQTNTDYIINFASNIAGIPLYGNPAGNVLVGITQQPLGFSCPLVYGYNISIGSYPTQRTMDTIQVQLNNNINTINSSDVLPALLRCSDTLDWEKQNMTASAVDMIACNWCEANNGLSGTQTAYDLVQGNKSIGNASYTVEFIALASSFTGGINNPPIPYLPGGGINYLALDSIGNAVYTSLGTNNFMMRVKSTEPLIAPPFIWNKTQSNRMGIYGLQNFSVVCNYGNLAKALKLSFGSAFNNGSPGNTYQNISFQGTLNTTGTAPVVVNSLQNPPNYNWTMELQPGAEGQFPPFVAMTQFVNNATLQMKYITPHGTDVKPLRNVIPLLEYPRFITSGLNNLANATLNNTPNVTSLGFVVAGGVQGQIEPSSGVYASQTYTLNQVPDKLIIFARPPAKYRNSPYWNDFVFPITNIVIQWNNHAGILANASQEQLFHMSKEAGSTQDWLQFQGIANTVIGRFEALASGAFLTMPTYNQAPSTAPGTAFINNQPGQAFPQASQINTTGSYLMLDVARHLELQEPFYAPGSLGSFQLQFQVTLQNYNWPTPYGIGSENGDVGASPEIVVIPVNSGIMVTEKGQTSCYSGILTKSDVLDASLQEPYGQMEIKRIVGHGHQDAGKALPKKCQPQGRKDPLNKHQNMGMNHRLM
jgi:hypothetical protein